MEGAAVVFVTFGKLCDHEPALGRLEAEGLMGELCWLNSLWTEAYELGDASYKGELAPIEDAHQTLGHYLVGCPVWDEYMSAYQELVDNECDGNDVADGVLEGLTFPNAPPPMKRIGMYAVHAVAYQEPVDKCDGSDVAGGVLECFT